MDIESRKRWMINVGFFVMMFALIYCVVKYGLGYVMPFFIGFIVAMILRPIIKFFEGKLRMNRRVAAIIACALFYLVIGGLLVLLGVKIISYIAELFRGLPAYYTNTIAPMLLQITDDIDLNLQLLDPDFQNILDQAWTSLLGGLGSAITSLSSSVVGWTTMILSGVPQFFVNLLFTIVSTFFIATDFKAITGFVLRQMKPRGASLTLQATSQLGAVVMQYLRSYSIILGISFVELSIGFLILKLDNFLLLGFLIAIFDILPVVGTGAVLIPWAIICFITGDLYRGIGLLILYVIITVIRNIIEPKIVGDNVGLHPLVTLIAMYVGAKLFGGLGLFGLPITLAILMALDRKGAINFYKKEPATVEDGDESDGDDAAAAPDPPPKQPKPKLKKGATR